MRLGDRILGRHWGMLERKMEGGYDHISLNICVELSLEMASKVIHICPRNVYKCGISQMTQVTLETHTEVDWENSLY